MTTPPPSPGRRDSVSPAASAGSRCGTTAGYQDHRNDGSEKCLACRRAMATQIRGYRARVYLARGPLLIDGVGTRRRLEALARIGWSFAELGERLGVSARAARKFGTGLVHRDTAVRVARLYDELWDQPGGSVHAAARAAAKGWLPPLAWDDDALDDPDAVPSAGELVDVVDELAVDLVLSGHRLELSGATAHAAVHALHARRVPGAVIAERCGLNPRQVERLKARESAPHRRAVA